MDLGANTAALVTPMVLRHTDAECTRLAKDGDQVAYDAARQQRLHEVLALYRHPWLIEQMAHQRRHQADLAVKYLARAGQS